MKRLSSVAAVAVLALLLTACPLSHDYIDYGVTYYSPGVQVDKREAAVGETVVVTLTGNFHVVPGSPDQGYTVGGVELGACFMRGSGAKVSQGGFCDDELPLPSWIRLIDGASYVRDFGEFVLQPGEVRKLRHTFHFTVTEPGEVVITSAYRILDVRYHESYIEPGNNARVVFE